MKKIAILVFVLVFAGSLCAVWAEDSGGLLPEYRFVRGGRFDAGTVVAGKTIEHTFGFINTGSEVLKIKKVKPG